MKPGMTIPRGQPLRWDRTNAYYMLFARRLAWARGSVEALAIALTDLATVLPQSIGPLDDNEELIRRMRQLDERIEVATRTIQELAVDAADIRRLKKKAGAA